MEQFDGKDKSFSHEQKDRRISDEELGNLVSAVGNFEGKAGLLIRMAQEPGRIFTERNLESAMVSTQGIVPRWSSQYSPDDPGWAISGGGASSWCRDSLVPIGLVAKEVDINKNSYGYRVTARGLEKGVVLAGLLLSFSYQRKNPLKDFFGVTYSPSHETDIELSDEIIKVKKRAPIQRIKIFWELGTTSLPARVGQLATATGDFSEVITGTHLAELHRTGIVDFPYIGHADRTRFRYNLTAPQDSPLFREWPFQSPIMDTLAILMQNPKVSFTMRGLINQLKQNDTNSRYVDLKDIYSTVNLALMKLRQRGFIHVDSPMINLTQTQRDAIVELITILDGFASHDPQVWAKGRKFASEFVSNPQVVQRLMEKAKASSSLVDRPSTSEMNLILKSKVLDHPEVTSAELRDLVENEEGIKISRSRVQVLMGKLRDLGEISGTSSLNGMQWNLIEK